MITMKHGSSHIEGSTIEIMADFTLIIKAVHEALAEEFNDEFARKTIAHCGRLAFMSDDEIKRGRQQMLEDLEKAIAGDEDV